MYHVHSGKPLASVLIGLLILASLAGYVYNFTVIQAPGRVLNDALQADLGLTGVTCTTAVSSAQQSTVKAVSLDLIGKQDAHVLTTLRQGGNAVTTEDIAVKDADYIRYTAISTGVKDKQGKTPDFSNIINFWAKQPRQESGAQPIIGQTALGNCIVPLVNLAPNQRPALAAELRQGKVFKTDLNKSRWHFNPDQPYRDYDVTIDPTQYITFMKKVDADFGLKVLTDVSTADYKNKSSEPMVFRVGATSHRIESIRYKNKNQQITFSDYGQRPDTAAPAHTIALSELEKRLAALQ